MRLTLALCAALFAGPAFALGDKTTINCGLLVEGDLIGTSATIDCSKTIVEISGPDLEIILTNVAKRLIAEVEGYGLAEDLLIEMAKRVAPDVESLKDARRELSASIDIVLKLRDEGRTPETSNAFLDEVFARMQTLTEKGDLDAAAAAGEEAAEALETGYVDYLNSMLALYTRNAQQHALRRDATAAAENLIKREILATPDPTRQVAALRNEQERWYVRGRDKGTRIDLEVAIALSRASLPYARNEDEKGAVLNDLGNALATLGARETGTERLEQAVAAYERALQGNTRERVPLDWARTQNNLGLALNTLGARETGTDRPEQAVAAYERALLEITRERVPLDWARTQNNLGNALQTLGQRETGTERLEQAVAAYERALLEITRERVPLDWAMTQTNLGTALQTLGERETGTERLEQAVAAYERALQGNTRERVPLDWARTQNNLGNALLTLGQRETGTERLEQAVAAYERALQEWTRERVPMDWAGTQMNLGNALRILGQRETGNNRLEQAVAAYERALQEWTRARVPMQWAIAQKNIARLHVAWFLKDQDPAHLRAALSAVDLALEVYEAANAAYDIETATFVRDGLLAVLEQLSAGPPPR